MKPDTTLSDLKEKLAAIEHERWSDWQKWMHSKFVESSLNGGDGSYVALPSELFKAWQKQIDTPYSELSDKEKASDMEQVDRYWPLVEDYITRAREEELKFAIDCGYQLSQSIMGYKHDDNDRVGKFMRKLQKRYASLHHTKEQDNE